MKKSGLIFLMFVGLLVVSQVMALAAPQSVIVLPTVIHDEERQPVVEALDGWMTAEFEAKGMVVIHGLAAKKVLDDLGVSVDPGSAINDVALLQKIRAAAGTDLVAAGAYRIWDRFHPGYRDAKCDLSAIVVDANGVVDKKIGSRFEETYQNDDVLNVRAGAFAVGTAVAAGCFTSATGTIRAHPAAFRTAGWVLAAASLIPLESRCDVQLKAGKVATQKVFGPMAAKAAG